MWVHTNCPLLFFFFFFALNFQIEMTVECPEAQKLKRISQKMFLLREKIKKRKISTFTTEKTPTSGFLKNICAPC